MKLVKLPLDCIVNLDQLTHADFSKASEHLEASLALNFVGDTQDTNFNYIGEDAERVWAYLVEQSYVMA